MQCRVVPQLRRACQSPAYGTWPNVQIGLMFVASLQGTQSPMASVSVEPERKSWSFSALLSDPRVDRTVAVIAIIPIAYLAYMRFRQGTLDIVRINLILQSLL